MFPRSDRTLSSLTLSPSSWVRKCSVLALEKSGCSGFMIRSSTDHPSHEYEKHSAVTWKKKKRRKQKRNTLQRIWVSSSRTLNTYSIVVPRYGRVVRVFGNSFSPCRSRTIVLNYARVLCTVLFVTMFLLLRDIAIDIAIWGFSFGVYFTYKFIFVKLLFACKRIERNVGSCR